MGFCVASTRKGSGSGWVTPSTVTWRSSMASSSADCVLGVARLISSASTTLAKIGPGRNSNSLVFWLIDRDAGDVAGQQVGRELDALEACSRRDSAMRARQHRLADARHVLDEHVPLAQQRHQRRARHLSRLPTMTRLDIGDDALAGLLDDGHGQRSSVEQAHHGSPSTARAGNLLTSPRSEALRSRPDRPWDLRPRWSGYAGAGRLAVAHITTLSASRPRPARSLPEGVAQPRHDRQRPPVLLRAVWRALHAACTRGEAAPARRHAGPLPAADGGG